MSEETTTITAPDAATPAEPAATQPAEAQAAEPATGQAATEQPAPEQPAPEPAAEPEKPQAKDPDDLPLGPETSLAIDGLDGETAAAYTDIARQIGLSPNQAKALASWQRDFTARAREQLVASGVAVLKEEWGAKAAFHQNEVKTLLSRMDRELQAANPALGENSFSNVIAATGADCCPDFVRGLAHIAALLAEDSIGSRSGASGTREETPLEGMKSVLESYRRK